MYLNLKDNVLLFCLFGNDMQYDNFVSIKTRNKDNFEMQNLK